MRGVTDGLGLRALALPVLSQGFVARVCCGALVNTRRCCNPGLNKLPSSLCWAISTYWGPGLIKYMAGCEALQGQKRILALSPDSTLMFLQTRGKLKASLAHTGAGALRARNAIHDIRVICKLITGGVTDWKFVKNKSIFSPRSLDFHSSSQNSLLGVFFAHNWVDEYLRSCPEKKVSAILVIYSNMHPFGNSRQSIMNETENDSKKKIQKNVENKISK